jgi:hypothetical protein
LAGDKLSTISEAKNILAFATVPDSFDQEFGIYDLTEFLGAYGMFSDPDIEFDKNSVNIISGKSKVKYRFADQSILTFPSKKINMPAAELSIDITDDMLNQIRKASSILGNTVASISSDGSEIFFSVIDPKNSAANSFSINIGENTTSQRFDFQFLIANLKLIPGDYKVEISSKLISHWTHAVEPIEYFLALEKTSSFTA